jgi:hypothetical protein
MVVRVFSAVVPKVQVQLRKLLTPGPHAKPQSQPEPSMRSAIHASPPARSRSDPGCQEVVNLRLSPDRRRRASRWSLVAGGVARYRRVSTGIDPGNP